MPRNERCKSAGLTSTVRCRLLLRRDSADMCIGQGGGALPFATAPPKSPWRSVWCWGRGWWWRGRSVSRQHNIGCECKPERVFAYKGNIREHRNDCEALNNERNDVYAENIEHRRRLLQFRTPFDSLGHNQDARFPSEWAEALEFDSSLSLGQKNAAGSV